MDAIRIENLRSLTDTGFVDLKPITLLAGQNSSGKSSFLRFFPLLRQSVSARTEDPINWYDERLVDFGTFREALTRKSEKGEIKFHFRLTLRKSERSITGYIRRHPGAYFLYILENLNLSLTLKIVEDKKKTDRSRLAKCFLSFADHQILLEFGSDREIKAFKINDFNVIEATNKNYLWAEGHLLPHIFIKPSDNLEKKVNYGNVHDLLVSKVKDLAHHFAKMERINLIASSIGLGSSGRMLESIKTNSHADKTWKNRVAKWTLDNKEFQFLRDLIIAQAVIDLFYHLDIYFYQTALNVRYIAPIRATAERYYRIQSLALNEVDPRGQNLAMFLKNLSQSERKNFEIWTKDHFGFILHAASAGGHISLNMKDISDGEEFNLADTGFGYSQILPILLQLWLLLTKKTAYVLGMPLPVIFAIEQPELHLHPGLQAKLADVFIASIKLARAHKIDLRLIIETHSEIIVNRMGHRIANGDLNPQDVNVVLFEKEPSALSTKVSFSGYDEEGFLTNWPIGFLEPDII